MSRNEVLQKQHDFIQSFINCSLPGDDDLADCIKAVIAQFVNNVGYRINEHEKTKPTITSDEFISIQQDILRECIVALEKQKGVKLQ